MQNMYRQINVQEDLKDETIDAAGFTGNFFSRTKQTNLKDLTLEDLGDLFKRDNKLSGLKGIIKNIDKEHNGYVTTTELEDILKILYPNDLEGYSFKKLFKNYCSSANKVLLDYKHFMASLKDSFNSDKKILLQKQSENVKQKKLEKLNEMIQ